MPVEAVNTKTYQLTNAYEGIVYATVRKYMNKEHDMCKCEKCFLDVCALVFNNGFCHFVTTEKGGLLARLPDLTESRDVELVVAVVEAIKLVKTRPAH